jgi:hypothetical protein
MQYYRNVWPKRVNVNQTIGNNYSGNTKTLFNVVDRCAMHITRPASAHIAAQGKVPTIAN